MHACLLTDHTERDIDKDTDRVVDKDTKSFTNYHTDRNTA